jgi:hypothetical protein
MGTNAREHQCHDADARYLSSVIYGGEPRNRHAA